jgi:FMN phosphatase YigB (HAD superfamily)
MLLRDSSKVDHVRLLICDLDNTLYDWVGYFVPSFYAMVDAACEIMNCDKDSLLDQLRGVHRAHHNTEHPFALLETETYLKWSISKGDKAKKEIDPAFHAFNIARKSTLKLYTGVEATLTELKLRNVTIVGYSDSEYFGVVDRVRRLGLERYFDRVFCTPRARLRKKPFGENSEFRSPVVVEHEFKSKKPNSRALLAICNNYSVRADEAVYVGDSLSKDIVMASDAGVFSSWAQYGTHLDPNLYEKLVRVSHWTKIDIQRERKLSSNAKGVVPKHTCKNSFADLLTIPKLSVRKNFFGRIVQESRMALGLQ